MEYILINTWLENQLNIVKFNSNLGPRLDLNQNPTNHIRSRPDILNRMSFYWFIVPFGMNPYVMNPYWLSLTQLSELEDLWESIKWEAMRNWMFLMKACLKKSSLRISYLSTRKWFFYFIWIGWVSTCDSQVGDLLQVYILTCKDIVSVKVTRIRTSIHSLLSVRHFSFF